MKFFGKYVIIKGRMNIENQEKKYLYKITEENKEGFDKFYKLLLEYNKKYNLTAITEEKDVLYKHFLDSALGEFLFPLNARVLEVGSGAGFPSLVLKLLRPDLKFTLLESIGKKCEFLTVAVRELGLKDVEILNTRAEELAKNPEYRENYDAVCARAVAAMNTLSEYCIPFVKRGGVFVAYKGGDEEEIKNGENAVKILGGKIKESYVYDLPENYGKRSLILVEKIKSTPQKYPRGNGKERKNPL